MREKVSQAGCFAFSLLPHFPSLSALRMAKREGNGQCSSRPGCRDVWYFVGLVSHPFGMLICLCRTGYHRL